MSDSNNQFAGLGHLVPGFDFLKSLTQGATGGRSGIPSLSQWIAPTLNVEDLDRRINELKTVQFWLDQNSRALGATIQALEVQKMTLATLKGMNFTMGELAKAFKLPEMKLDEPAAPAPAAPEKAPEPRAAEAGPAGAAAGVVDPMEWWNSLTNQFQTIATNTIKDVAAMPQAASEAVADAVASVAAAQKKKPAKKAASSKTASKPAAKKAARKTAK